MKKYKRRLQDAIYFLDNVASSGYLRFLLVALNELTEAFHARVPIVVSFTLVALTSTKARATLALPIKL